MQIQARKGKIALLAVVLLLCGAAVLAATWVARREVPASPSAARSAGPVPASAEQGTADVRLRAPDPGPAAAEQLAPQAPAASAPGPRSILEEDEAWWERLYGEAALPRLELDLGALREEFQRRSKPEFERRFDDGRYEWIQGATEPRNEPWRPGALLQLEMPGGEAADQVHRVVLYPREVPELYALQAKIYWLEQRIQSFKESGGG